MKIMWGLFFTTLLFSQFIWAGNMIPTEIYAKCYGKISNQPVDLNSQDYKAVEAGSLDPVTACLQLLDKAKLQTNVDNTKFELPTPLDETSASILQNFQTFHESWFSARGENFINQYQNFSSYVDAAEQALFLTKNLFTSQHYKDVFSANIPLRGMRRGPASNNYSIGGSTLNGRPAPFGPIDKDERNTDLDNFVTYLRDDLRVPQGQLIGISRAPEIKIPMVGVRYRETIRVQDYPSIADDVSEYNLTQNYGGGILGTPSYLSMNRSSITRLDGGLNVQRRLANNFFYDLMCLSLPNLKSMDVNAYLDRYKDSELPFRTNQTCALCHATLDPFADVARNIRTMDGVSNNFRRKISEEHPSLRLIGVTRMVRAFKVRTNAQTNLDEDNSYQRRRPDGKLFYRNYDDKLIDQNVTGLAGMGAAIAEQDDPYLCAAQRYYAFLTGINMPISSKDTSEFVVKHRSKVIEIGKKLKEEGSLRNLVKRVLESEAFQTRNPGLELANGGE